MTATQGQAAPHKQEIHLADYQAPDFTVDHVEMTIRLDGAETRVVAALSLRQNNGDVSTLDLDGGPHMTLLALAIDGEALDDSQYEVSAHRLRVHGVSGHFKLTLETRLDPEANTRLEGLYRSGGTYCTQCEAEGFRHITYFPDRPDVLATYRVRVEGRLDECPVLLANGNPLEAGQLDHGWHYATWDDPIPKPCYLFAVVAGDLVAVSDRFTTREGRDVALNIYVRAEDQRKCDHAMQSLKRAMAWDEEVYGCVYDLDVYNIVAVSDFNMGAMENKGLNVFNTKYVLATQETATDADHDHIEGVIAHEYFHNWTGNRVTCRDWFQLSLKEGLTVFRDQQFSADMTSPAVKRLDDVRVLRFIQFAEDAGPLSHPVRPEKYIEINNFYTSTVYNKGAELIRMLHGLVGADAFRRGMDLYFARHDGAAVTCEDFVQSIADGADQDLSDFFRWYRQSGTPELTVTRSGVGHLCVRQTTQPTPDQAEKTPLVIPLAMGWLDPEGREVTPSRVTLNGVSLDDARTIALRDDVSDIVAEGLPEGCVPSLLRGFSAPVRLKTDLAFGELLHLARFDTDAFARWEASQEAGQALVVGALEGRNDPAQEQDWFALVADLVADQASDPALLAEMLKLPSESLIAQSLEAVDPVALHQARQDVIRRVAAASGAFIRERYVNLAARPFGMSQDDKAARRLKNVLLGYLGHSPEGRTLIAAHYDQANNMTDRLAAFMEAVNVADPVRERIVADFYKRYQSDALVIDKWFSAQAMSIAEDTLARVVHLTRHRDFAVTNPNRLRALVMGLALHNPAQFHKADGAGYLFLADMVLQTDRVNPQTAARLVAPLGSGARIEPGRRDKMKAALEKILAEPSLSDDVRELAEKAHRAG